MSELKDTEMSKIAHDWKLVEFGVLLEIPLKNGVSKPSKVRGTGFPMVNMKEIFSTDVIDNMEMELAPLTDKEQENYFLAEHDLLFARQSLVLEGAGKCSIFISNSEKTCFESHLIRARLNKQKANPYFYYTFFSSKMGKRYMSTIAEQAVVAGIRGSDLKELKVPYPSLREQVQIANLFSNIDNKITLLRQQNQDLEELAQVLFKRWFVEFEFPNENGEPYKSSGGKMVESELGEIPEGWEVGCLGEFSNLKSGYAFKSNDFVDDSFVKAIKIKDLKGKGVVEILDASSVSEQVTTIERVKYFKLEGGDIVLAMSGNTTGKIGIIPPHDIELYLNQRVGKFFLKKSSYKSFLYNFLMSGNYEERILSMGYGSAQPNINPSQIESIKVLIPSEEVLTNYIKISEPIYNKVLVNNEEIQTLTQLRDTLLPKLMSGELRVKTE